MNKIQTTWEILQRISNKTVIILKFLHSIKFSKRVKLKFTNWELILANCPWDKGLLCRTYTLFKIHASIIQRPNPKVRIWNKCSHLRWRNTNDKQICEKSSSFVNWEMQIKTTLRLPFTPERMAIINTSINNKCWWGCGMKGEISTLGGSVDFTMEIGVEILKELCLQVPFDTVTVLWISIPKN